ncbi:hypothetical protein NHQ30_003599 [Ciborinia camelliae]|nr:hypothetical protein NHQ30_003599 [Ciborinia camelliae]
MGQSILSEQGQQESSRDQAIQARARKFHPAQYFRDITPANIIDYDGATGLSTLESVGVDLSKNSKGSFQKALVVAVDGACPHNGTSLATKSSFGIFFGPESPLNTCDRISRPPGMKHTNNYAELISVLHALELIKHHIKLRNWRIERAQRIEHVVRNVMVIMMTDSEYVHDCLTKWIQVWLKNGFKTSEGNPVANADALLRIHEIIQLLSNDNIDVRIWSIRREQNQGADALANLALQVRLPSEVGFASRSLQYFQMSIRINDPRVIDLLSELGIFSLEKDFKKMNLGEIIMYMLMAGKDRGENFTTLFGPDYSSDHHYIMYRKLCRTVLYLLLDKYGYCSYPDVSVWGYRKSTYEYGFAGGHPRPIEAEEAEKLQQWCINNNLFSNGERLTALLELIHTTRLEFGSDEYD